MKNWNTDITKFKSPAARRIWELSQLINYGLDGEKLDKDEVKKAWPKIKDQLDSDRRKTIEFYIWGRKWRKEPGLLPDRSNFWQWYSKRHISSKTSI